MGRANILRGPDQTRGVGPGLAPAGLPQGAALHQVKIFAAREETAREWHTESRFGCGIAARSDEPNIQVLDRGKSEGRVAGPMEA
jgi:hypothetical protein